MSNIAKRFNTCCARLHCRILWGDSVLIVRAPDNHVWQSTGSDMIEIAYTDVNQAITDALRHMRHKPVSRERFADTRSPE